MITDQQQPFVFSRQLQEKYDRLNSMDDKHQPSSRPASPSPSETSFMDVSDGEGSQSKPKRMKMDTGFQSLRTPPPSTLCPEKTRSPPVPIGKPFIAFQRDAPANGGNITLCPGKMRGGVTLTPKKSRESIPLGKPFIAFQRDAPANGGNITLCPGKMRGGVTLTPEKSREPISNGKSFTSSQRDNSARGNNTTFIPAKMHDKGEENKKKQLTMPAATTSSTPPRPINPSTWSENGKKVDELIKTAFSVRSYDGSIDESLVRRLDDVRLKGLSDDILKYVREWKVASRLKEREERFIGAIYGSDLSSIKKETLVANFKKAVEIERPLTEFVVHDTDAFGVLSYSLFGTRCVSKALKFLACISYLSKHPKISMDLNMFKQRFMSTAGSAEEVEAFSHLCYLLRVLAMLKKKNTEESKSAEYHALVDEQCAKQKPEHLALLFTNQINNTFGVLLPRLPRRASLDHTKHVNESCDKGH